MPDPIQLIVRGDPDCWFAWSPQAPGLVISAPDAEQLRSRVNPALAFHFGTAPRFVVHLEQEVDDLIVRVCEDDAVTVRIDVAERVRRGMTVDEHRRALLTGPPGAAGEVVCVCGVPSDTIGWVVDQMVPGSDVVLVALGIAEGMFWTTQITTNGEGLSLAEAGVDLATTLGQLSARLPLSDASSPSVLTVL